MKLLFDQNLSPRLVQQLSDLYPDSAHVWKCGLDKEADAAIWKYAAKHGYIIVSQDADFGEMSDLLGFPPKVVWIRRGNCTTSQIESSLRKHSDAIAGLARDSATGVLTLF